MGLILDSSVLITGERRDRTVRQILEQIQTAFGEIELAISVVTVVELAHGVERANDNERRLRRQTFGDELTRDVPSYPITVETARLAGRIEGQQASNCVNIAFEDLLIPATALQFGFAVVTENVRHFEVVPGLVVMRP